MPWCPICKNEYVDGVTECSDCKVPLVDSLEESRPPITTGTQDEMERLYAFLEYSKFKSLKLNHNEETDTYELYCQEKDEDKVRRASTIFYQQESLRKSELLKKAAQEMPETILGDNPVSDLNSGNVKYDCEEAEASVEDDIESDDLENDASLTEEDNTLSKHKSEEKASSGHTSLKPYQKKSEKAADFKSSAYTLLFIGLLGLIALICIEMGILPIHLAAPGKYLTYSVMGAMFVIFIIVGIFSFRSSKKYEADAKEEETFISNLKDWATTHIDAETIRASVCPSGEALSEELAYFKISEVLKSLITTEFGELDEAFIEDFIDTIYHEKFEAEND